MGAYPLRHAYTINEQTAATNLTAAHDSLQVQREQCEAALKEYTLAQQRKAKAEGSSVSSWFRGIYYLTLARWTNPPAHQLALKTLQWMCEEN